MDRKLHDRWWDGHREQFALIPDIQQLLAEGKPVTLDQVAAVSTRTVAEVEAYLRQHPATERDERGRLVGFGLTLRPTPHRFTFDGRTVYGWCATDTLIFPVLLDRSGVIESTCPVTGQPISIEVSPQRVDRVDPPGAVVTLVRPDRFADMRAEGCDLGLFFASREATAEWRAAYPEGMVHTIAEDFQLNREMVEKLGWTHSGSAAR